MTLTIGRLDFEDPFTWDTSGPTVDVTGDYNPSGASAVTMGIRTRNSLMQMADTVQAIYSDDDSDKDGFYRVVSVSAEPSEVFLSTGYFRWAIQLEELPHKRSAHVEMSSYGAERTNAPGPVTGQPWLAVPASATAWRDISGASTRYTVAGSVKFVTSTSSPNCYGCHSEWLASPSSRFAEDASVTFDDVAVVGEQDTGDFSEVVISNHILELSKGSSKMFSVRSIDMSGSAPYPWGSAYEVGVGYNDPVGDVWTELDPDDVLYTQVILEGAEACAIRLFTTLAAGSLAPITIDVYLRRGSCLAEIVVNYITDDWEWGLSCSSWTGGTISNAGIRSGTLEGVERCGFAEGQDTPDTSNGLIWIDGTATQARLGFGVIQSPGGSGTAPDDRASVRDQFFAGQAVEETISQVRV